MSGMRMKSHRNHFVHSNQRSGRNPWDDKFRPSPWATPSPKQDAHTDTSANKPRPIIIAPPPPLFGEPKASAKAKRAPAQKAAGTAKRKVVTKTKAKAPKRAARKSAR